MPEPQRKPAESREPDLKEATGGAEAIDHLVLYDGVCGLCDRSVRFLLRIDRHRVLRFATLQGETAKQAIERLSLPSNLSTMVYIRDFGTRDESASLRSTGALRILNAVGGIWRWVSWLRVIPRPLRDAVYGWVARNRYAWFGRFDVCKLPEPETRARFLD